jgi:hypothetical protein
VRTTKLQRVTVCAACERASCWQGVWPCADARGAGRTVLAYADLDELGLEHPDFWTKEWAEMNAATTRKVSA